MKYSVVIPVFNSENILGETIEQLVKFFEKNLITFELILVNDGSTDFSWRIIEEKVTKYPKIIKSFNLAKNYGQHVANLCGFRNSEGDYVITMDDDLQNPPNEILKLIKKTSGNYDLIIGKYEKKYHSLTRRLGSKLINYINSIIFDFPKGLVSSNFRIIRKDLIEKICNIENSFPYIPGLLVKYSSSPINVTVLHAPRKHGNSNYNYIKIIKLIFEIVFGYSTMPLRLIILFGITIAFLSFLLSSFYIIRSIINENTLPGWTTLVVLLSLFNGVVLISIGILGEYIIRLVKKSQDKNQYYEKRK